MYRMRLQKMIPALLILAFLAYGNAWATASGTNAAQPAAVAKDVKQVYVGKIAGKSNKAKTISITVGKGAAAKTIMVRFDENSKGVDFARKGEAAIIQWEKRGDDVFATVIKPKLAKLPKGVTEVKVDEMYKLIMDKTPMTLVDARPEARYGQGHLPGAISISVGALKKNKQAILPPEKDKLLIFYCGGYT